MKRFEDYAGWTREELVERVLQLEHRVKEFWAPELRLSPKEGQILLAIFESLPSITVERIATIIYADSGMDLIDPKKVIYVLVHRLKKKIASLGVVIHSAEWKGYWLLPSDREVLQQWKLN